MMTNRIAERPARASTYAPPTSPAAGRRDAGADPAAPSGVVRRVRERFALIAFALYYVPLFLNHYPSLGGGGFKDDGLAVRWGHVFTPVGVWVARHVFHMTGPMPSAYQGDNGDIGEEFGRLLVAVVLGVVGAVAWTLADRKRPRARWVGDALQVVLRYSIALGLTRYAVAKLLPVQFPPLSAVALERRVGELSPFTLLWQFMEYSRPYAFFGGLVEMVAVLLLCVRRTTTLGALLCLAVMTNVMLLNYAYDVPVKLYATMIVLSAAVLVLYDFPRLFAVFVTNRPTAPAIASRVYDWVSPRARWTMKTVLVGSVILSSVVTMRSILAVQRATSPGLNGGWAMTSFPLDGQPLDSTGGAARWRRFVVDAYAAAIRFKNDSLLMCRRMPSAGAATIALACATGRRGELQWTRTGDVLQLEGTFDGARVKASGRALNRSDSRLLRGGFHWISDR